MKERATNKYYYHLTLTEIVGFDAANGRNKHLQNEKGARLNADVVTSGCSSCSLYSIPLSDKDIPKNKLPTVFKTVDEYCIYYLALYLIV
jgi:hypothetical protein